MAEAYSWIEATVTIWTGNAVPVTSAVIAYAKGINGINNKGLDNRVSMGGTYRDHLTGQRADITIGAFYTYDTRVMRIEAANTAVHMKLNHSSVNGSAGFVYYSGRFDNLALVGGDGQVFEFNATYHSNAWSGYGGTG